jgi:hypothetical protein
MSENGGVGNVQHLAHHRQELCPYTYIFRSATFYTSTETPDELGHDITIPLNIPKQNKLIPLR